MNWLIIIFIISAVGIITDVFRLCMAYLFHFDVEEFSLFTGPKLFSFKFFNTTFTLRLIPLGASLHFNPDTFFLKSKATRLILTYFPDCIAFILVITYLITATNPLLILASNLFIAWNLIVYVLKFIFTHRRTSQN